MLMIVGNSGNLSQTLQRILPAQELQIIGRDIYDNWIHSGDAALNYINELQIKPTYIINTVGLINKNLPIKDLIEINTTLPLNLLKINEEFASKIITFGTVHERDAKFRLGSKYIESKGQLFDFYQTNANLLKENLHFQIHTWYGGPKLHKEMLLGQIVEAINQKSEFKLLDGNQIREYHHIEDDCSVIKTAIYQNTTGIVEISHNEVLTIKRITESIINYFARYGKIDNEYDSEMSPVINKNFIINTEFTFRRTIPGIIDYLERVVDLE